MLIYIEKTHTPALNFLLDIKEKYSDTCFTRTSRSVFLQLKNKAVNVLSVTDRFRVLRYIHSCFLIYSVKYLSHMKTPSPWGSVAFWCGEETDCILLDHTSLGTQSPEDEQQQQLDNYTSSCLCFVFVLIAQKKHMSMKSDAGLKHQLFFPQV